MPLAYRLPSLEEAAGQDEATDALELDSVTDEEFTKLGRASNNSPRGIWSDGEVMYVADASDGRVYTCNMPDALDARLLVHRGRERRGPRCPVRRPAASRRSTSRTRASTPPRRSARRTS